MTENSIFRWDTEQDGAEVTKVWYTAGGRSIFLQNTENTLKIVICTGDAIASYYLDAGTGSITREQGTMKNDVLTGEYTCDISSGENGVDLSSLWNSRGELEYTTYQGEFDDEGKTLLEQPGEAELKKLLEGSGTKRQCCMPTMRLPADACGRDWIVMRQWRAIPSGVICWDYRVCLSIPRMRRSLWQNRMWKRLSREQMVQKTV